MNSDEMKTKIKSMEKHDDLGKMVRSLLYNSADEVDKLFSLAMEHIREKTVAKAKVEERERIFTQVNDFPFHDWVIHDKPGADGNTNHKFQVAEYAKYQKYSIVYRMQVQNPVSYGDFEMICRERGILSEHVFPLYTAAKVNIEALKVCIDGNILLSKS